jgi:hypothetical protein
MRMKNVDVEAPARLVTQFDIQYAFQRRGIGLHCADLMSFESHEMLRRQLQAALTKPPPDNFIQVNLTQILDADQVIWRLLNKHSRNGIKRRGALTRPLDDLLPVVLKDLDVKMALMPRQGVAQQRKEPALDNTAKLLSDLQKQIENVRKEAKHASAVSSAFTPKAPAKTPAAQPTKGSGKGNDAKKRKKGDKAPRLPKGLEDCSTVSSAASGSKRFCFSFNMSGCKDAKPGHSCGRGAHLCMKTLSSGEACSGSHPQSACTAR